MKKKSSLTAILILVVCSLSVCSCLSINRNIKVNKDGSGYETIKITFLKEFYTAMSSMTSFMDSTRKQGYLDSLYSDEIFINKAHSQYDTIAGIKLINISSVRNPDSSNTFTIEYNFDSISRIASSLSNIKDNDGDNSKTTVAWIKDGGNMLFNYKFDEGKVNEMPDNDSLSEQVKNSMAEMFGNGRIKFEIEFPYTVISSNSTSVDGNILTWDFPLTDLIMKGKMDLEAVMKEN